MGAPEMHSDLYREHMTGDPAYDKAFAALADCPSFAEVEQALKTYAHELAEKIMALRANVPDLKARQLFRDGYDAALMVAALEIDPEVLNSGP